MAIHDASIRGEAETQGQFVEYEEPWRFITLGRVRVKDVFYLRSA